jgi:hypothetical protein
MPPARVTDSDILAISDRMNEKRSRIDIAQPKFHVEQHVRISKENIKFAKAESRITTRIFFGLSR